jgi:mRNA interferase MazF
MKKGDIVLIPFPFSDLNATKIRPAVVISETFDKHKDIIIAAISSVVPKKISKYEILLLPNPINQLRKNSILKVDRIVTIKKSLVVAQLGKLSLLEQKQFSKLFCSLVD